MKQEKLKENKTELNDKQLEKVTGGEKIDFYPVFDNGVPSGIDLYDKDKNNIQMPKCPDKKDAKMADVILK